MWMKLDYSVVFVLLAAKFVHAKVMIYLKTAQFIFL